MRFNNADLGGCHTCTHIKDFKVKYYNGNPYVILVEFDEGIILEIDAAYLDDIKEAKKERLVIDVEYKLTARRKQEEIE